jgi:hypothetical protein
MKKTTNSNPLKFFNDAKEARNKSFSKSLIKAQNGLTAGPLDENTSKYLDNRYPGKSNNPDLEKAMKTDHERLLRTEGQREYFNAGPMYTKEDAQTVRPDTTIYQDGPTFKKGGTHKMPNGKIMLNSKMKVGGATKATKFAALAFPYNKATAADRIAGAKKNASKKK